MITAYFMLRVALGLNILLHGLIRLQQGRAIFIHAVKQEFEGTILPGRVIKYFAVVLPFAETAIGILLLFGLFTTPAITAGFVLMLFLVIGKSVKQDWQTVSFQMIYILMYAAVTGLRENNIISLDYFFNHY